MNGTASVSRYGGEARYFWLDPRRVRALWARTGEIFPVYTSFHIN
eukprot:SAG11_NODE_20645_length_441_cov_0.827485_1_plen_44_part_01